jgi:hypothetical protein
MFTIFFYSRFPSLSPSFFMPPSFSHMIVLPQSTMSQLDLLLFDSMSGPILIEFAVKKQTIVNESYSHTVRTSHEPRCDGQPETERLASTMNIVSSVVIQNQISLESVCIRDFSSVKREDSLVVL